MADEDKGIQLNGVAHVILTVSTENLKRTKAFYRQLCTFLGLSCVLDEDVPEQAHLSGSYCLYFVGGRTAIGIARASSEHQSTRFDQQRCGLHNLCWRAREQGDVARFHRFATERLFPSFGGRLVHGPEQGPWAPGYYSVLFEDPDGIRLEINHVPGKGLLASATPRVQSKL